MSETIKCPICLKENIKWEDFSHQNDIILIKCDRCGSYPGSGRLHYNQMNESWWEKRHILSAIIRNHEIEKIEIPIINTKNIEQLLSNFNIPYTPKERADRFLFLLSKLYPRTGEMFNLKPSNDYPLCYGEKEDELDYYIDYLVKINLLEKVGPGIENHKPVYAGLKITVEGWEHIHNLSEGLDSNEAFVAMWFNDEMDKIYKNGIKPALVSLGYKPINIKFYQPKAKDIPSETVLNKVDDNIIARIRECSLLIADVTGIRHSVYFEVGFAFGLNKNVIWTCRDSDFENAEEIFDTRQYHHIKWENADDLKKKLIDRIEATVLNRPKKPKELDNNSPVVQENG